LEKKIQSNIDRDKKNTLKLLGLEWRVLTVWECAYTGKRRLEEDDIINQIEKWLFCDNRMTCEIASKDFSE